VGATRSSSEVPGKPNADEGALHEKAIADCERNWDRGDAHDQARMVSHVSTCADTSAKS